MDVTELRERARLVVAITDTSRPVWQARAAAMLRESPGGDEVSLRERVAAVNWAAVQPADD